MCARISSTRRRGRPFGPSAWARYWRRCWAILRSTASSTTERLRAGRRMGNANRPQEPSFTVGIEEEYLLVDCETRDLVVDPPDSLMTRCEQELGERVAPEFLQSQIKVGTSKCATVAQAGAELAELPSGSASCRERVGQAGEDPGGR